jgi:SAM-dependent methyltransferase
MAEGYRYDSAFFDYIERGSRRSAAHVVGLVARALGPASVIDVGCGRGTWISAWIEAGVADCIGVDGDYVDRGSLVIPPDRFVASDLARPFDLARRFDLVESLETAEHIHPSCADIFLGNLVRHGGLVLFSAAVPGQGGETHVNEQPLDHWRRKFLALGYDAYDWLRPRIRDVAEIEPWYRYNALLYATDEAAARLPPDVRAARVPPDAPLPNLASLGWRARNACLRCLPRPVVHRLALLKHKAQNLAAARAKGEGA